MPVVANTSLPSFERFRREGGEVLSSERAGTQDIRELHIGLMNNMPDAALEPTERQFLRLVGGCNRIAQFYLYPFSPPEVPRGDKARQHIAQHYFDFDELKEAGMDALIITGANPVCKDLSDENFWTPMCAVLDWATQNVTSTLCACLATHAALKHFHGIERQLLPAKRWGVFAHRVALEHPLVRNINTRFDVPHSRWNEIYPQQMTGAGMLVLVQGEEAGVHLATSADGFRFVYFQGHPEYDSNSLLKEYKREVNRYLAEEVNQYPPYPEHYFQEAALRVLAAYREQVQAAQRSAAPVTAFPENEISVDNTWSDTGKMIFNNWLGTVYQITDRDRRKPFMNGVDPADPLAHVF